jgi:hypothetical protein
MGAADHQGELMKTAPQAIERESAFLLLVLQSGIGLITAVGPIALAFGGMSGNAVLGLLTIVLAIAELVLAVLFLRGSRRAATWLAGYQALCLWGAGLALSVHLGADNHFAPVVTNLVIPTLLLVLLLRSRRSSATGADQVPNPVEEATDGLAQAPDRSSVYVHL